MYNLYNTVHRIISPYFLVDIISNLIKSYVSCLRLSVNDNILSLNGITSYPTILVFQWVCVKLFVCTCACACVCVCVCVCVCACGDITFPLDHKVHFFAPHINILHNLMAPNNSDHVE